MAIADFNHIKEVLVTLDTERPARFSYTESAVSATGDDEITALTGVYAIDDSSQINSIPTEDQVAMDSVVMSIGLRSQAATLSRMMINHFFGRLGLNLLKLTEKVKLLASDHLVNRYITPSGKVMESISITAKASTVEINQNQSLLANDEPLTAATPVVLPAAVSAVSAGVMTGADKKTLDDAASAITTLDGQVVKTTGAQSVAGLKTFSTIPAGPSSNPTLDDQFARKAYVDTKVSLTGDQSVAGVKTFGAIPVGPSSNPTLDNQLARKAYVDTAISNIPVTAVPIAKILRKAAKPNLLYKRPMGQMITEKWYQQNTPVDNDWRAVTWSPELGIFVAIANTGTLNRVMTSPNGINWTIRSTPVDNDWHSVCWSPELGIFVAVSYTGTLNRVMTSPDGITWTIRSTPVDNNWFSVTWSPELGIFVAVSISGALNRVMTSPDGINWTIRSTPVDNDWFLVTWSPELGIFVAIANTGTLNRVMTSPDGINWTIRSTPVDNNWNSVCWSPELGIFVAVSDNGTLNRVMTSPNGINWTIRSTPVDNQWFLVTWSPELGIFVAVSISGALNRVMTSRNMKMILG